MESQEKEKNELRRELHDKIIQLLATRKMYQDVVNSEKNLEEDLLDKSFEYVNNAMEEIREISPPLVAQSLGDISLKETLQRLLENINLINNLQVQLTNINKYTKTIEAVISIKTDKDNLF